MRMLAVLVLMCVTARGDSETDILKRYGVLPEKQDLSRYLRTLYPDAAMLKVVEELVSGLGSDRPGRRVEVSRGLARLGAAPIHALEAAARDFDPEVARSARKLLAKARTYLEPELMYAAFKTISRRSMAGLLEEIIHTLGLSPERYVRDAARRAFEATVRRHNAPRLRELLRNDVPHLGVPAAHALARALGAGARADLVGLLKHGDDGVRAAAAWELADQNDRACFATLSELLDSCDIHARLPAWRALLAISGERFGYAPYEGPDERKAATAAWRHWIARHAATVSWKTPLGESAALRGRFLVSIAGKKRVVELDNSGTQTWEVAAVNPWCCSGVRNGHRLITHFDQSLVIEYDAAGNEVWRLNLPGKACSVQRLDNGSTLVAIGSVGKVIEYRPDGKTAWEIKLGGRPFFATRQADGTTLVSLHDTGRIVEVARDKTVKERFKGLRGPYSFYRIDNGNWLICLPGSDRVVELTPSGKEVWSIGKLGWPASACRLASGATVIAHRGGLEKILPSGARSWLLRVNSGTVFVSRY